MKNFFIKAKKYLLICVLLSVLAANAVLTGVAADSTNTSNAVYSLDIEVKNDGTTANVCILADGDCSLFVALYDENGKFLASNKTPVTGSTVKQNISFKITETETEFYYAKAFLWNAVSYAPLCESSLSFHTDKTTVWECKGDAYYDTDAQQYTFTNDYTTWSVGAIWFGKPLKGNFTVDMDYYTGSWNRSGNGGDGMVVAFYANDDYDMQPVLGFTDIGYGIELDTWSNSTCHDPSYNHIALIKDDISNHCSYAYLPESEDESWHHLKIVVKDNVCSVYVDGNLKISENVGATGYDCLGISAGTGDAVNLHAVKNILVTHTGHQLEE